MAESRAAKDGQAIKAIVSLAGPQDVTVTAHRSGTDGAAVSVRVGKVLIYLGDRQTAVHFRRVWESGARRCRDIAVRSDRTALMPVAGVAEPSLLLDASDSPPAVARLRQEAGRPSTLWVNLGRIAFDVRDQEALRSTLHAFQRAERLAIAVMPEGQVPVDPRTLAPEAVALLLGARSSGQPLAAANRVAAAARRDSAPVRAAAGRSSGDPAAAAAVFTGRIPRTTQSRSAAANGAVR